MYQFILLNSWGCLRKISIKIHLVTDVDNRRNKIWTLDKDEIGISVQNWLWVQVDHMVWEVSHLEYLDRIQLLGDQIQYY